MDISGRTVLIVGGTSGIGLGLARRLAAAGSDVIVGGRTTGTVDHLKTITIDVSDPDSIRRARDEVLTKHSDLDLLVTMSGVMLVEDLRDPAHLTDAETTISVNLLGTIRVIDAFTPHLLRQGRSDIITVTSGIAFLPFPLMPTYAASKAGVHAYTESLRAQLAGTGVEVTELVPPAVATAGQAKANPAAQPLEGFLDEVIELITATPTANEIVVRAALPHRWAEPRRHLRRPRRAPPPVPQHPARTLTPPPLTEWARFAAPSGPTRTGSTGSATPHPAATGWHRRGPHPRWWPSRRNGTCHPRHAAPADEVRKPGRAARAVESIIALAKP